MSAASIGYRSRNDLPRLGDAVVDGETLLDTNVFINALAGRGPTRLRVLLADLPHAFVSGPTLAELNWPKDVWIRPIRTPHACCGNSTKSWRGSIRRRSSRPRPDSGRGRANWPAKPRAVAGGAKSIRTAFDRVELINDAATVALDHGLTVVTQDGDFDLFLQLAPGLRVLFYD